MLRYRSTTATTPGRGSNHFVSWSAFARGATHVAHVCPSIVIGRTLPGGRASIVLSAMVVPRVLRTFAPNHHRTQYRHAPNRDGADRARYRVPRRGRPHGS